VDDGKDRSCGAVRKERASSLINSVSLKQVVEWGLFNASEGGRRAEKPRDQPNRDISTVLSVAC